MPRARAGPTIHRVRRHDDHLIPSTHATIHKHPSDRVSPNLPDYARTRVEFSLAAARARLAGLPRGGLNIAFEAVDRQAAGLQGGTVALRS